MALTSGQYLALKSVFRALLSGNRYAPNPSVSEATLFSFVSTLLSNASGKPALSTFKSDALNTIFRSQISSSMFGVPAAPTVGNLSDLFTQLNTDASGSAALPSPQYSELFGLLRAALSDDTAAYPQVLPEADVLSYFAPFAGTLRFIATRTSAAGGNSTGTTSLMSRFGTFARDNITSLKLAWSNWINNGTNPGMAANVMSIAASIEYPAGTFTQVTFSSATTGVAPALTTLYSDTIPVVIPNGAQFWVRTWQTGTLGVVFSVTTPDRTGLGEASSFPGSNQTMSGSVTDNANQICMPCAIIGTSAKPAAFIIGDSRQAGNGDSFSSASGGFGQMGYGLNNYAWSVIGVAGQTAAQYLSVAGALQADLAQWATDIVCPYGINDITAGTSAATLQTTQGSIRALYPTKKFHVTTLDCVSTSTDAWATLVNQTTEAHNAARVTYNTAVRLNSLGFDPAFDCAAVSESSLNSGLWQVDGTANKYTVDGTHPSPFLYALYGGAGFTL